MPRRGRRVSATITRVSNCAYLAAAKSRVLERVRTERIAEAMYEMIAEDEFDRWVGRPNVEYGFPGGLPGRDSRRARAPALLGRSPSP